MYYDHEFIGNQGEPCENEMWVHNSDFSHDIEQEFCIKCETIVQKVVTGYYDGEPNSWRSFCACKGPFERNQWVCALDKKDRFDVLHSYRVKKPCGASWTSVLHPPDQFRHWCSILEAGGDCMHMEFED